MHVYITSSSEERRNNNKKRLFPWKQRPGAESGTKVPTKRTRQRNERMTTMMYMTLTLLAGVISVMFVTTAVSSIINAVRESEAAKEALGRTATF